MTITIIVTHHQKLESELLPFPYTEVCNANGEEKPEGFTTYDVDFVDNISSKNKLYCELSPLYSFWKQGLITDTFGLVHYRRMFSLGQKETEQLSLEKRSHFFSQQLSHLDNYTDKVVVGKIDFGDMSTWDQFNLIHPSLIEFLSFSCGVFADKYPELGDPTSFFKTATHLNHCNMFIAPKQLVEKWCDVIFNFLFSLESSVPNGLNDYNSRWAGFLSERFFTYYITSIKNDIEVVIKPIVTFV